MRVFVLALAAAAMWAEGLPPGGVVRGVLVHDGETRSGLFTIRTPSDQLWNFRFDSRTWMERGPERVTMSDFRQGEQLEVVCDRDRYHDLSTYRYARMVQAVTSPQMQSMSPPASGRYRLRRSGLNHTFTDREQPDSVLIYTGIVLHIDKSEFVLLTRFDGAKTLEIRSDTLFLQNGLQVASVKLAPQTHVFIRAGIGIGRELEAYQVIWGTIITEP